MAQVQILIKKALLKNSLLYPVAMWLVTRLFIWAILLLLAPMLPSTGMIPGKGWEAFSAWDSLRYHSIATSGYEYADDLNQHNLAFFPLFPLIMRLGISIGIPFNVAGTLLNNIAFLAALYCLYFWVEEHNGSSAARWTIAVATWFPMSLFSTVIYTEGLYLLLSTAALQSFDSKHFRACALWGAMASATRPTGMVLPIALFIAAWKQRLGVNAYIASLTTATGVVLFSLFCAYRFHDPLGFIHAQRGWRSSFGFYWEGWWKMLMQITVGTSNWRYGWIKDPLHPLLFALIVGIGYLLWRFRTQLGYVKLTHGFGVLFVFLWLLAGDSLINTVTILGGAYLLWHLRTELTTVTLTYGFCGIGLLLASGGTLSLSRLAYGIVSLSVALGVLLSRHPRWGYQLLFFFAILITTLTLRFAQHHWIG